MKNIEHLDLMFSANFDDVLFVKKNIPILIRSPKITSNQNPQD
jgi:hypothetical protein